MTRVSDAKKRFASRLSETAHLGETARAGTPAGTVPPAGTFQQLAARLHVGAPRAPVAADGPTRDFSDVDGPGHRPEHRRQADARRGFLAATGPSGAPLQRRAGEIPPFDASRLAGHGHPRPQVGGLPSNLRKSVEARSGLSMDDVRVHRHSPEPARIGALAYAQGRDIHLAPGQDRHLAHEAWHVVQQAQGRVRRTGWIGSVPINSEPRLEREADNGSAEALSANGAKGAASTGDAALPVVQRLIVGPVSKRCLEGLRASYGQPFVDETNSDEKLVLISQLEELYNRQEIESAKQGPASAARQEIEVGEEFYEDPTENVDTVLKTGDAIDAMLGKPSSKTRSSKRAAAAKSKKLASQKEETEDSREEIRRKTKKQPDSEKTAVTVSVSVRNEVKDKDPSTGKYTSKEVYLDRIDAARMRLPTQFGSEQKDHTVAFTLAMLAVENGRKGLFWR